MIEINKIYYGDSFILDKDIADKSIDMILEDMPYNVTDCEWDCKIDLEKYWKSRLRIIKDNGIIILTATQPFASDLIQNNRKMFKYEIIWNKVSSSNFVQCNQKPLPIHENILIFYNKFKKYKPLKTNAYKFNLRPYCNDKKSPTTHKINNKKRNIEHHESHKRYPTSIITISRMSRECNGLNRIHSTQKPIELFAKLIKMFSNENDLIFDGFAGSGTTGIAAIRTNRNFICFEKDLEIFNKAQKRIKYEQSKLKLPLAV